MAWICRCQARHAGRALSRCVRGGRDGRKDDAEDDSELGKIEQAEEQVQWEELRVLTYNIFCRPPAPHFSHNNENDFKDERLEQFIRDHLDKYDVVCLQEMFGAFSQRRRYFRECARAKGFRHYVSSPCQRPNFLVDGGLLILSRVPVVRKHFLCFTPGVHTDRMAAKGVVHAELDLGTSRRVHFFCTHLQASYPGPAGDGARAVRRKQIDELSRFVRECVSDSVNGIGMNGDAGASTDDEAVGLTRPPIVLAGDLNFNGRCSPTDGSDSDEYTELVAKLGRIGKLRDVMKERYNEHPVTYADISDRGEALETVLTLGSDYDNPAEVKQSLDYIFFSPGVRESWKLEPQTELSQVEKFQIRGNVDPAVPIVQLSDHYGLEAVFKVM